MQKRYVIYCDESDDKGRFYPNFYGGILIEAFKQEALQKELQNVKNELNIFEGEIKWERISAPYVENM